MMPDSLLVTVATRPAPQGSKNCSCRGGRAIMFEQTSKHLKPFRRDVKEAAIAAMDGRDPMLGPLCLTVTFVLQRPASSKFVDYPAGTPDLSKLTRALEDAFTDAKVWGDDAQVCELHVSKVWTDSPGALSHSGVSATVSRLLPADVLLPLEAGLEAP